MQLTPAFTRLLRPTGVHVFTGSGAAVIAEHAARATGCSPRAMHLRAGDDAGDAVRTAARHPGAVAVVTADDVLLQGIREHATVSDLNRAAAVAAIILIAPRVPRGRAEAVYACDGGELTAAGGANPPHRYGTRIQCPGARSTEPVD